MTDDGVPARHALDADGEHDSDDRGQALRYRCDSERNAENEHVQKRRQPAHVLHDDNRHDHHNGNDHHRQSERLADAIELFLKRRGLARNACQHPGDPSHLGPHPGGDHHRASATEGHRCPAVEHVRAVAQTGLAANRLVIFRHWQTFARQRRLRRLQRRGLDDPRIGGDRVAFLDKDDVARHEIDRWNGARLFVANHSRVRGRHLSQGRNGRFGSRRLDVTHDGVEQHHAADGNGFVRQRRIAFVEPEGSRYGRRDEKKDHQDVLELREELSPARHWRLGGQLVRAVPKEAFARFAGAQTTPRVAAEGDEHLVERPLIFGHHPWSHYLAWLRDHRLRLRGTRNDIEQTP